MNRNDQQKAEERLFDNISALAEQMKSIYNDAVMIYTPMVNDICNRKASEKEISWMLTWLLDYAGEERMLKLFKKVCRRYWQIYSETIVWYIMEYRKWYDPESLKGTKWEYLLEDEIID